MTVQVVGPWSRPKLDEPDTTNDDAARFVPGPQNTPRRRWRRRRVRGTPWRVAIADGASTSFLARQWAELVADAAVAGPIDEVGDRLEATRPTWGAVLSDFREQRSLENQPLAWFEESKLSEGAAATLVMVEIDPVGRMAEVRCIGDAAALLVRDGKLLDAVPTTDAEAFDNHPTLVRTVQSVPTPISATWDLVRGDRVIVASDGLAAWLLARAAEGPLETWLDDLTDEQRFADLTERERRNQRMADDDVTCIVVEA